MGNGSSGGRRPCTAVRAGAAAAVAAALLLAACDAGPAGTDAAVTPAPSPPVSGPVAPRTAADDLCAEPETAAAPAYDHWIGLQGAATKPGLQRARASGLSFDKALTGADGHVFTDLSPRLTLNFDRTPEPAWVDAHVATDGEGAGPEIELVADGRLVLSFPEAPPGAAVTVTVTGIVSPAGDTLAVTLCRAAPPDVTAALYRNGVWTAIDATETVAAPVRLRLQFSEPMDRDSVAAALRDPEWPGARQWTTAPALAWHDDRTVDVTWADVGPAVYVYLNPARSRAGLHVTTALPVLYAGPQPQLVAVDPGDFALHGPAADIPLAALPPNVTGAYLSPAGDRALIDYFVPHTGASLSAGFRAVVDLRTGQRHEPLAPLTAPGITTAFWTEAGLALYDGESVTVYDVAGHEQARIELPEHRRVSVSPAGERLAVLQETPGQSYDFAHPWVWHDLAILSANGEQLVTVPRFVQLYRPPTDGYDAVIDLAWSPDGRYVAALHDGEDHTASLVIANTASGDVVLRAPVSADMWGSLHRVTWSPDGRYVTAGPFLLAADDGEPLAKFAAYDPQPGWSADGDWLLWHERPWGPVYAYNIATDSAVPLGDGFAAGWDSDGRALIVRWERPEAAYDPLTVH